MIKYLSSKPTVNHKQPILGSKAGGSGKTWTKVNMKNAQKWHQYKEANTRSPTPGTHRPFSSGPCFTHQSLSSTLLRAWEFPFIIFILFVSILNTTYLSNFESLYLTLLEFNAVILASAFTSKTHQKTTVLFKLLHTKRKRKGAINIQTRVYTPIWRPHCVTVFCGNWGSSIPEEKSQLKSKEKHSTTHRHSCLWRQLIHVLNANVVLAKYYHVTKLMFGFEFWSLRLMCVHLICSYKKDPES